jgi:hypothetical protein
VADAPPDSELNPISKASLAVAGSAVASLWKRIERRAPPAVRGRVEQALATAAELEERQGTVSERLVLAKELEDLAAELRGRRPWEPTFYRDGRLAIVRAQDPIKIQGAVDQVRIEVFFERYVRRAEQAFERLEYFLSRAGVIGPPEKKVEKKPWEQPYIGFDQVRELLWGKVGRNAPRVRRE